jgi:hypothetical protein
MAIQVHSSISREHPSTRDPIQLVPLLNDFERLLCT